MPRRKRPSKRLAPSIYLEFFTIAAKAVRAAGFETLPGGGIFGRQEMDRMDEWCERGDSAESFAAWIIEKRSEERQRDLALAGENFGDETIAPSEVAA